MRVTRPNDQVYLVDDTVKEGELCCLKTLAGELTYLPAKRFGTTREGLVKFVPHDGGYCWVEERNLILLAEGDPDELAANILGTWRAAQILKRHRGLCERRPAIGRIAWECWEIVQTHSGIKPEAMAKIDLSGYPGY